MFISKSITEVVVIEKDTMVVGLNLQSSGLPISFDSLGEMWDRLTGDVIDRIHNKENPVVQAVVMQIASLFRQKL